VSARKEIIESYFEGFRRSDHKRILDCLTEDVVWDLPGFRHLEGKTAFDTEIENPAFTGSPTLVIDRLIEGDDAVVAIGTGIATPKGGDPFRFAYCDVFTFANPRDLIRRVESYLGPLKGDS
jgi:uncharacterized protein